MVTLSVRSVILAAFFCLGSGFIAVDISGDARFLLPIVPFVSELFSSAFGFGETLALGFREISRVVGRETESASGGKFL